MASTTRIALGIVSFVTMVIFIIAFVQLELVQRLEDSYGKGRHHDVESGGSSSKYFIHPLYDTLTVSNSNYLDKEAVTLRLGLVKPEIISWSPRIIHLHNFLSDEECEYLIALAMPRLRPSNVVNRSTGGGVPSKVRTSYGMFVSPKERKNPVIETIETRISIYTQVPVENGESLQVLRYEKDQHYLPHNDYFSDKFNIERGGQRIATVLMYLSEGVEGGETVFPRAGSGNCSCGGRISRGMSVKPVKGDAVLFWSMGLDGQSDPNSVHGGCDVVSGVKWSATKWMRQRARSIGLPKNKGEEVKGVATI